MSRCCSFLVLFFLSARVCVGFMAPMIAFIGPLHPRCCSCCACYLAPSEKCFDWTYLIPTRSISTTHRTVKVEGKTIDVPLSPAAAADSLDGLAKEIYCRCALHIAKIRSFRRVVRLYFLSPPPAAATDSPGGIAEKIRCTHGRRSSQSIGCLLLPPHAFKGVERVRPWPCRKYGPYGICSCLFARRGCFPGEPRVSGRYVHRFALTFRLQSR